MPPRRFRLVPSGTMPPRRNPLFPSDIMDPTTEEWHEYFVHVHDTLGLHRQAQRMERAWRLQQERRRRRKVLFFASFLLLLAGVLAFLLGKILEEFGFLNLEENEDVYVLFLAGSMLPLATYLLWYGSPDENFFE